MGDAGKMGAPERPVFFFDIDNCLYSRNRKVHDTMHVLISVFLSNEDYSLGNPTDPSQINSS